MFCRQWLAVVFCVNTLVFGCGLWQASTAVAHFKLSFSKQRLGQCQRDVLAQPVWEEAGSQASWKQLSAWCQAHVFHKKGKPSVLEDTYLWINDVTVQKCMRVSRCESTAWHNVACLLMLVAVTAALDYHLLTHGLFSPRAPEQNTSSGAMSESEHLWPEDIPDAAAAADYSPEHSSLLQPPAPKHQQQQPAPPPYSFKYLEAADWARAYGYV